MVGLSACPLAIIGMAVRLPGAGSLDEFWNLCAAGGSAIGPLPASRLDRDLYYLPGQPTAAKTYTQLAGSVADTLPPAEELGLTADELADADPAHVQFLATALDCLRHAGIAPDDVRGANWAVFVGHARGSPLVSDLTYNASIESLAACTAATDPTLTAALADVVRKTRDRYPALRASGGPFTQPNAAASIVARRLGTTGPYQAVDAACASSFAALDLAARAIHAGRVRRALVGGCSFNQWSSLVIFSQAQALSATGSFPFDARADGFISSDGYAAVLVEPLADAIAAGRDVHGVIRALGASCDGRGKSLWAPLKDGQVLAIQRAYADAANNPGGVDPACVQAIEAHATGTKVGDATELSALAEVFSPAVPRGHKLPIASLKSNIGHTRETAGVASLIKMCLAMQRGRLPPSANFRTPSPEIDWATLPFRVLAESEPWPDRPGQPRCCAIDAFGIGGLNYHVVVEAAPANTIADPVASNSPPIQHITQPAAVRARERAEPIAICGLGLVLPGASHREAFRNLQRLPLCDPPRDRWDATPFVDPAGGPFRVRSARGGFIRDWQFDWRRHKVPPKQVDGADPLQFMLIEACHQALLQAALGEMPDALRRRVGVYVGTIFGSDFTSQTNLGLRLCELSRDLSASLRTHGMTPGEAEQAAQAFYQHIATQFPSGDEGGSFSSSTLGTRICKQFDLMGPVAVLDAEEASSLAAMLAGVDALRAGHCDVVLAAGAQRTMHITRFLSYDRLGRLAHPGNPTGFCLGEGAVAVVLRRLSDVRREKTPTKLLAVVDDITVSADASDPPRALARVREQTDDRTTILALAPRADEPDVAGELGMFQGAHGLVAMAHAMMKDRTAEQQVRIEAVGLRGLAYAADLTLPNTTENAPPAGPRSAAAARILRIDAATEAGALARVAELRRHTANGTQAWDQAGLQTRDASAGYRVRVVAASAEAVQTKLAMLGSAASSKQAAALHEQGVFAHCRPTAPGKLAFVFAGQGSQYAGMLRRLVTTNAAARDAVTELNTALADLHQPSFETLAWAEDARLGEDTFCTQAAVFCADMIMYRVLTALGVRADVHLAHSYGEYAALCAAGSWSMRDALSATLHRSRLLDARQGPAGRLLSTDARCEQIAELQQRFLAQLWPANYNSPEQTVLACHAEVAESVVAAIEAFGRVAKLLAVPQPFHSPMLAELREPFAEALADIAIHPPRTPLLSSIFNQYVAEPADIRRRLVAQFVEPLRFVDLIGRAWDDGVRVFVEVGPRTIATRLIRSCLADRPVLAVCSDHPKVDAGEQLLRVQALLETQDLWPAGGGIAAPGGATPGRAARVTVDPSTITNIPHFDATERRRNKLASRAAAPESPPAENPTSAVAEPLGELERWLVEFVCEQTGYPREVVTLDQDLEADLGIDSIKKAQLLGELRDHFKLELPAPAAGAGLSLAQFVTLRDVAGFLTAARQQPAGPSSKPLNGDRHTNGNGQHRPARSSSSERFDIPARISRAGRIRVVHLYGSPFDMGVHHGRTLADGIRSLLAAFKREAGPEVLDAPILREALEHQRHYFDEPALDELRGIATGSDVPFEHVLAANLGLDPSHTLVGCAQLAVRAASNHGAGLVHAVNEDSPMALRLGNRLARVLLVRHCGDAQPCCVVGSPGQLGGINGVNAAGLAISSTMLLDQPRHLAAVGGVHPNLVLRILERSATSDDAITIARHWRRVGAWSLLISDARRDELAYLEYDGERLALQRQVNSVATTNHSRLLDGQDVPEHSRHRLSRCETTLTRSPFDSTAAQAVLRDRYDAGRGRDVPHATMNTVCRVDNQMSMVISGEPGRRQLALTAGPASDAPDAYETFDLTALFATDEPPGDGSIMRRWVLRAEPASTPGHEPRSAAMSSPQAKRTLIVGGGDVASELARQLESAGTACACVTAAQAMARLAEQSFDRLILLTAMEAVADWFASTAAARRAVLDEHAWMPFRIVRAFVAAAKQREALAHAELVAVTQLGGDFGLSPARPMLPAGGAITGLFKALRRELTELPVRVLDVPAGEPAGMTARNVVAQLAAAPAVTELALVRGNPYRVRMYPRPARRAASPQLAVHSALSPEATWIVTGGGRGVTALVARMLAETYGVRIELFGTTPADPLPAAWTSLDDAARRQLRGEVMRDARAQGHSPDEAWRAVERRLEVHANLAALHESGVHFGYHVVDLANADDVAATLARIRSAGRSIRGILHGAGYEHAAELLRKQDAAVERTLASKVLGLQHIVANTYTDSLAAVVAFGSVSGRFGGLGQADYSLASDLIAKLTGELRRRGISACTMHWPAWADAGMAMRPESRVVLEASGQAFMPADEGFGHLAAELEAGLPEHEVVILDRPDLLDLDHTAEEAPTVASAYLDATPLLDGVMSFAADDQLVAELTLDPKTDPFLLDHQLEHRPILPAVIGLEAVAEACTLRSKEVHPLTLEEVIIHAGVRFHTPARQRLRVVAEPDVDGRVRCGLMGDFFGKSGRLAEPGRVFVSGLIRVGEPEFLPPDIQALTNLQWQDMQYPPSAQDAEPQRVYHGPLLRALRRMCAHDDLLAGEIIAGDPATLRPASPRVRWRIPAAVLDGCLVACGVFARKKLGIFSLPAGFGRLIIRRQPAAGEQLRVAARFLGQHSQHLLFDFILSDSALQPVLWSEQYRTVIIGSGATPAQPQPPPAEPT